MTSKLNLRVAVTLFAVLALGLMFLLPGGPLQAQDNGPITYAENDMSAVATFTGNDPEERMVYWSILDDASDVADVDDADIADADHFMINSDGVLNFKFPPDYESPMGGADNTNTYNLVVVASDDAPGADDGITSEADKIKMAYKKVTVMVTDVDEPGMVSLSAQQPQTGRELTATLTDDDATPAQVNDANWKWEHSSAANGPWTSVLTATAATYSPLGVLDKYLRATATYTDEHGSDKTAQAVSANMVRAEPAANNVAPAFPPGSDARSVDENSPPGTRVGEPVVANDVPGDVLTYTLTGVDADNGNYRIDQATGQITVGPGTTLDAESGDTDAVTVTATDPMGGTETQEVTITITNVNEAPMMTAGVTRNSQPEYDSDDDAGESEINAAKLVDTYTATDPEISGTGTCVMASCTWSVSGTDAGDFRISNEPDGTFGTLTFKDAPDFEMPADSNRDNVYMVTVVLTDQDTKKKLTATRDVTITLTNMDEDGTVTLSSEQPKVGIPLTATLEDPDGVVAGSVRWTWHTVSATEGTQATDENAIDMAISDTHTPMETGSLSAKATYTDGEGTGKSAVKAAPNDVVANTANVAPEFPEAETGMREVAEGTDATTNIGAPVAAMDANPSDALLTYTLSGTNAASFTIVRSSGQLQTKAELDHEKKPSYAVTVKATDSEGLNASIQVTIKVADVDEAPEIAGEEIAEDFRENGTNLEIERFRATDPERRTVYWSLADDSDTEVATEDIADRAHFTISSNGVLSFKFSPDYELPRGMDPADSNSNTNTYKVVVAASDDAAGVTGRMTAYRKVTVMVTNVAETGTVTLSTRQAQVGVPLTATYNDLDNERPDGTDLTWKWYLGRSQIDGAETATYEPTDTGSLRVEASYTKTDGNTETASKTVSVRATPEAANAAPNFGEETNARSVDENSAPGTRVGQPVAATDRPGDVLTYTLTDITGSFQVDQASGQITVAARTTLDTETTPSYTVTVAATDPAGESATQEVTITINDVNETPAMTEGFTRNSQPEYDSDDDTGEPGVAAAKMVDTYMATDVDQAETVSWSVSGTDADDFDISTSGELTFKEAPDFEMPTDSNRDNVYMATVVATDAGVDGNNKMTAERAVVVTVTNMDEDGTVTLSSEQPKVGIPLTATLEDPDGVVAASVRWTWHAVEATNAEQATDENAIDMATSDTHTPMDTGPLSAKATYTDREGTDKSAVGTEAAVVANLANVAPEFPDTETGTREVAEDTEANENIGLPVVAQDTDTALTYTLSGTDAESFGIGRSSGQLQTKAELDYETKATYMVTVTATDSDSTSASIDVTIKVANVDEVPEIMLGGLAISGMSTAYYEENRMDAVETYMANGPRAARANWSLEGEDAGDFRIANDGMLRFRSSPDYETPKDGDTDNTYRVTVKANDGTHMDTKDVTVMVTDVEELGRLSGHSSPNYEEGREDAVATYTASGPDTATWSLEGTDRGYFTLTGGVLEFRNAPNYEMPRNRSVSATNTNIYVVTVKANAGGETDEIVVTVTVDNAEEIGRLSGNSSPSHMENSEDAVATYTADGSMADVATWSLSGTDMRYFTITGGILNFRNAPDFERPSGGSGNNSNTYTVTVRAQAGGEMGTVNVTVDVTNQEETGAVTLMPTTSSIGREITADLTDPDTVTENTVAWQWSRSTTPDGTFADIGLATQATYTPVEDDLDHHLKATAGYTDGHGSGKSASAMTAMTADHATLAISGMSVSSYLENGQDAVGTYTASGPQATSANWTPEGADAGDFMVQGSGASVMLKFISPPDYENAGDSDTDNAYQVTLKATDGTNTATHDVTVTVADVDEIGTLSGDANPNYEEDGAGAVGTYTVSGGSMSDLADWSLMGDDMDHLSISASGVLTFDATPDFETPMDADTDNQYMVAVRAEGGGEMRELTVTVTVTNMDEDGTVTLLPMRPSVGTEITATLTDPDMTVTETTWQWSKSTTMDGTFTPITGATSDMYTPVETDEGHFLKATASYTDGEGAGKSADEMTESPVSLFAIDGLTSPDYMENGTDPVETYTTTGDAATTWTLEGDDADKFTLTDGILSFTSSPNYEIPMDVDTDNVYMATLKASDGTHMDTKAVTVTVTNEDETGMVTLMPASPMAGTTVTATLTDVDGTTTGESWNWLISGTEDGTYTAIPGAITARYVPTAEDATKYIRARAMYADPQGANKVADSAPAMVASGDSLLARYDVNRSDVIDKTELITAINDYLGIGTGQISKAELIRLINLYLGLA